MLVFISWSGPRSKAVAEAFKDFLPNTIQSLEPWLSTDIDKGERWSQEIADRLEKTSYGIVCLTPENLREPWVSFEAGALSKTRGARVATFLLDLTPKDVTPPLNQFQHTEATKDEVRRLLGSLNAQLAAAGNRALDDGRLDRAFAATWPEFERALNTARSRVEVQAPGRDPNEMVEEILLIVRGMERNLTSAGEQKALFGGSSDFWEPIRAKSIRRVNYSDGTEGFTFSRDPSDQVIIIGPGGGGSAVSPRAEAIADTAKAAYTERNPKPK